MSISYGPTFLRLDVSLLVASSDETGSSAKPVPTAMELERISTSAKQKRSSVSKIGPTHRHSNIESKTVPELASRNPEKRNTVVSVTNPAIFVDTG